MFLGHGLTFSICALFPCSCSIEICSGQHQTPNIHVLLESKKRYVVNQIMTASPCMQHYCLGFQVLRSQSHS